MLRGIRSAALLLAAALMVALLALAPAHAQDLTSKPIRVIVGLAAGGGTDVMARLIAQKMSENMKATVLVENKGGGNFIPALKELTNSEPDGHTLFFISTSTLITQPLHADYPFDLLKLTPITEVATGPLIMVVKNALGVKTLKDFIALAKSKPGALTFGAGGGTGSSLYFATELLKAQARIQINTAFYRGAGPALNDLLGDHIDGMFDAMPVMSAQAKEGKVTPLGVTSAQRSPILPDVPTIKEQGFPNYEMYGWFGILAPEGTPAPIAQKLRDEVAKAVADPGVIHTLAQQGMVPRATQPGEWKKYLQSEFALYSKIIKDADIKP